MSLYKHSVTVPKQTTSTSPYTSEMVLPAKHIVWASIRFPDGTKGTTGVRFMNRSRQFAPFGSGWIADDDNIVQWEEQYTLDGPPWIVTIEAYNVAGDYDHTVEIRLVAVPYSEPAVMERLVDVMSRIERRLK